MEAWKAIPEWPDYEVSSLGRVMSKRPIGRPGSKAQPWRVISGWKQNGYIFVTLTKKVNKKSIQRAIGVHHLILISFKGNPKARQKARHLNDIRDDNRLENLAWGTQKENMADAIRNGRMGQGTLWSTKKSIAMKGNKHLLGHTHSEETRAKMSATHKRMYRLGLRSNQ